MAHNGGKVSMPSNNNAMGSKLCRCFVFVLVVLVGFLLYTCLKVMSKNEILVDRVRSYGQQMTKLKLEQANQARALGQAKSQISMLQNSLNQGTTELTGFRQRANDCRKVVEDQNKKLDSLGVEMNSKEQMYIKLDASCKQLSSDLESRTKKLVDAERQTVDLVNRAKSLRQLSDGSSRDCRSRVQSEVGRIVQIIRQLYGSEPVKALVKAGVDITGALNTQGFPQSQREIHEQNNDNRQNEVATPPAQEQPNVGQEQPNVGQDQPKSGQEQPKQGQDQPKSGQEQPKQGQDQPKSGQEQPKQGQDQPKSGQEQPKQGQDQPKSGQEQPKQGQDQPKSGQEQPKQGQEQPKLGQEQPKQGQEQPKGGKEQSKQGQEQPKLGQEQPKSGQEQPGQGQEQPKPGQEQQKPGQEQPKGGQGQSKPGQELPKEGQGQPKLGQGQSKTGEELKASQEPPKPGQEQPKPGDEKLKTGENQTTSGEKNLEAGKAKDDDEYYEDKEDEDKKPQEGKTDKGEPGQEPFGQKVNQTKNQLNDNNDSKDSE